MNYEFITYDKLNSYLNQLINTKSKNKVIKHLDLGYSPCGFPIEHYSIGYGKKHLVVIAGTHGTEIIGIDFVLKLMKVISEGIGLFKNFDENSITIDFIPCQNPESFIIVTDSLDPFMKNLNEKEFENISKEYYLNYTKDDKVCLMINKFLKEKINASTEIIKKFWNENRLKDISQNDVMNFIIKNIVNSKDLKEKVNNLFDEFARLNLLNEKNIISKNIFHYQMFENLSYKSIEEKDIRYVKLKNKLEKIMNYNYNGYYFPKESVIDFRANSNGIDLNKNNPSNFKIKNKEVKESETPLFGNLRFNKLMREVPGPQGMVALNKNHFTFEPENIALLKYLLRLRKEEKYISCLSYHGTGGVIYSKPLNHLYILDRSKIKKLKYIDEFNNDIAINYQKYTEYKIMPYPEKLTGTGDMIRQLLPGFLIVELSKMGGNPIGPYGDKNNYIKVINDNINAFYNVINLINEKVK